MSVDAIFDQLDPVLTRWTIGGSATELAPQPWQPALGDSDLAERELRLLALSGQFLGLCVALRPAGALKTLPDLPPLAAPFVPENLASLVRRCFIGLNDPSRQRELIQLLAARGYAMHPAVWLPSKQDDALPDLYLPWRNWLESQASEAGQVQDPHDELTQANWHEWLPAARQAALIQLRERVPMQATALLEAKAAGEAAPVRLKLLGCLSLGLSEADAPYLESLRTDRAPKVQALATSLLARLGRSNSSAEDASELAGFFEFKNRGLLRRSRALVAKPIKTEAQRSRRTALFEQVDFEGLTRALSVQADELIGAWPLGDDAGLDQQFAAFTGRSASDDAIATFTARLTSESVVGVSIVLALVPRLNKNERYVLAKRLLHAKTCGFADALAVVGAGAEMTDIFESTAGKTLMSSMSGEANVMPELQALSLMICQSHARAVLDRFVHAGLGASDPRFDLIRLNASLDPLEPLHDQKTTPVC